MNFNIIQKTILQTDSIMVTEKTCNSASLQERLKSMFIRKTDVPSNK